MRLMSTAALVLAATLVAAPEAQAQMSFSVAAGATMPVGDDADDSEMGYHATLGLGIKPLLSPLGVRIEGMFNSFDAKEAAGVSDDANTRIMALTANATLSGPMLPMGYLIAGVGMYNSKLGGTWPAPARDPGTDFGFNIGGGINLPLTGFSTYAEIRYHHIPMEGGSMKMLPISVGIRF